MPHINENFLRRAEEIASKISQMDNFLVVSHHDADGVAACAITVDLLKHLKKNVEFMIIKQLDSVTIDRLKEYGSRTLLITDMGSGQLSLLKNSKIEKFFVLDHHVSERDDERQLNPSIYGYDGGLEISGSGVAYMITRTLRYKKMAHIAVVGAVGDMQDSGGKLESLNRVIIEDAVNECTLRVEHDIRLFGRQSRPLIQMLAYASDPIIPEICGNEAACGNFLKNLDIESKRKDGLLMHYVDLDKEGKKKLISGVYMHLLDYNIPEYIVRGIVGEVYTLLQEEERTELRDAKEFATLLNACGRQDKPEIGVEVCLGDRSEYLKKARTLLEKHRRVLRGGIEYLKRKGVSEMENLYYFDASGVIDENIVGVIAGMGYGAQIFKPDKPILAFAEDNDDENWVKVSARANWSLVRKGIHLGNALKEKSKIFGGEGGGHDIAAGARIPRNKKEEFLKEVDKIFKEQFQK